MEYKQTKKYMLHKLNTAFESFENLTTFQKDAHQIVVKALQNSLSPKAVSLEHCLNFDNPSERESLLYSFVGDFDGSNLYIEVFKEAIYINIYADKKHLKNYEFYNLEDLSNYFLKMNSYE